MSNSHLIALWGGRVTHCSSVGRITSVHEGTTFPAWLHVPGFLPVFVDKSRLCPFGK